MKSGKKKSKNVIMLITLGVVAAAVGLIALLGNLNQAEESTPGVDVMTVAKGDVSEELGASGTVESDLKKTFYSPVNAQIKEMGVEAGDSVTEGQSLIAFDLEDLEKDNQKAELNVKSSQYDTKDALDKANSAAQKQEDAKKQVPQLEADIESQQAYISDIKNAISQAQKDAAAQTQAQAEQAQAEAQQRIEEAQAEAQKAYESALAVYRTEELPRYESELKELSDKVNECTAQLNQAETGYNMAFENWKAAVSEQEKEKKKRELDQADQLRSEAQAALQQAQEKYNDKKADKPQEPVLDTGYLTEQNSEYGASSDLTAVTADTSELESQLEQASSDLAQMQSELASQKALAEADDASLSEAAKSKLEIANNLSELEAKSLEELIEEGKKGVHAEFTGVISDSKVTQGSTVTQGMELFTLQSTDKVSVSLNISKYDYDKVKVGQKATVELSDHQYDGTVTRVSKIAIPNEKGTPMIGVTVRIDHPDDNIFIGVEAKVTIQADEAKDVPILPVEVVNIGKDGSFCYVVEDGVITKKAIETGVTSDSYVEVVSGLKEGDQVIKDIGNHEEGDAVEAVAVSEEDGQLSPAAE